MRFSFCAVMLSALACTNGYSAPSAAKTPQPCIQFSVLTQDTLKNVKAGLSPEDQKWFRDKVEKKYPSLCYAPLSQNLPVVFVVIVTPDTYHGTRVITDTKTQDNPISGTVTDDDGNTADISATERTTTTSSTPVPYSFEYGIYTLNVEEPRKDGSFVVLHRFQQKGIYRTMYGIPLGGKGHHPLHAVIEEAAEWVSKGGLAEAEKIYPEPSESANGQADRNTSDSAGAPHSQSVAQAVLDVSSTPAGAEIEVDGSYVGDSPAALQVTPGVHIIMVKKTGYVPWERKITAMPGHANLSPELQSIETGEK